MSNGFPWFRLYASELIEDKKIKRIQKVTGLSLSEIRGAWLTLMCLASDSPQRGMLMFGGNIPFDYDDLAEECGMESMKFHALFMHFTKMEMVSFLEEEGIYFLPNWDKRQPASDANGAERVKRYRNKKKQAGVTLQKRYSNALDKESEEDKDKEKENNSGEVFRFYQNNIGNITPFLADEIGEYIERCGSDWVIDAMKAAVKNNARKWAYVKAILDRWVVDGRETQPAQKQEVWSEEHY